MSKAQKVTLVFEKNGTGFGLVDDCLTKEVSIEIPRSKEGFDVGMHLIGAKVSDKIDYEDHRGDGQDPTGWETQVAVMLKERDVEKIVGKVLTIVDATMMDAAQRKAFKTLIKQAIYGQYNIVRERSYQIANEPPVLIGLLED